MNLVFTLLFLKSANYLLLAITWQLLSLYSTNAKMWGSNIFNGFEQSLLYSPRLH